MFCIFYTKIYVKIREACNMSEYAFHLICENAQIECNAHPNSIVIDCVIGNEWINFGCLYVNKQWKEGPEITIFRFRINEKKKPSPNTVDTIKHICVNEIIFKWVKR